jgi:hypothetical protein
MLKLQYVLVWSLFSSFFSLYADSTTPENNFRVVERGPNHRIIAWESSITNNADLLVAVPHAYTELSHGMHYFEDGQWLESQALIEPHPQGAVALHGSLKVWFSSDIAASGAIDILTPTGEHLINQPVGLALKNKVTGESKLIAQLRSSKGEIIPPNQVIYRECFEGLKADFCYTYGKGSLEADIILREKPVLPEGFTPENTRLELITEFFNPPLPRQFAHMQKLENDDIARAGMAEPDLIDETLNWERVEMGLGTAFQLAEKSLAEGPSEVKVPVAKRWIIDRGRYLLVEMVDWVDVGDKMITLSSNNDDVLGRKVQPANKREWPQRMPQKTEKTQMAKAATGIGDKGFVLDYTVLVDPYASYTFTNGATYYASAGVRITTSTTFQSGAIIKFATNAWLQLSGTVNCSTSGTPTLFTAKDDWEFGEAITNSTNVYPITNYYANPALNLYYVNYGTTIRNVQIRHANMATLDYSPFAYEYIYDSQLEHCSQGIVAYYSYENINNLVCSDVTQPMVDRGYSTFYTNNISYDTLVNNASSDDSLNPRQYRYQMETTVVVQGTNIIVGFNDFSELTSSKIRTGYARSTNNCLSFADKGALVSGTNGNNGDPMLACDSYDGSIYFDSNPISSNGSRINFHKSTDGGNSFSLLANSAPGFGINNGLDKPWLTVDNSSAGGSGRRNIYQAFINQWGVYNANNQTVRGTYFSRSFDGTNWDNGSGANSSLLISPYLTTQSDTNGMNDANVPFILCGTNHELYLLNYQRLTQAVCIYKSFDLGTNWSNISRISLSSTGHISPITSYLNIVSQINATTNAIRNICQPQAVIHPGNGYLYLVYGDKGTNSGDQSDIYLTHSINGGTNWSPRIRVNNDTGTNDQWNPSIAINQSGTKLYVGFYDRRQCSSNNWISVFASIGSISGTNVAMGSNFRVSSSSFPSVETVYQTDYDSVASDAQYFYHAWTDTRRFTLFSTTYFRDYDIRLGKIKIP